MITFAPNIELFFTEAGDDLADRVRAAAAAGFDAVEMWMTIDRDIDALDAALRETGVELVACLAEPRTDFSWPGTDLMPFFDGLAQGVANATTLRCPRLVLGSGLGFPGMKRAQNLEKLIEALREAVARSEESGIELVLEPVNTRVDHPGALLDRTREGVDVVRAVGSPRLGILYDMYHSITEGEDPAAELAYAGDAVRYVQIADVPGRGQPGAGEIDWPAQLRTLTACGYSGPVGIEAFPTVGSVEALRYIATLAEAT